MFCSVYIFFIAAIVESRFIQDLRYRSGRVFCSRNKCKNELGVYNYYGTKRILTLIKIRDSNNLKKITKRERALLPRRAQLTFPIDRRAVVESGKYYELWKYNRLTLSESGSHLEEDIERRIEINDAPPRTESDEDEIDPDVVIPPSDIVNHDKTLPIFNESLKPMIGQPILPIELEGLSASKVQHAQLPG